MIDAEFVEAIASLAVGGVKPEIIDVSDNQRIIVAGGAVIREFTKDEPFGKLSVVDFSSFVDACLLLVPKADQAVINVKRNQIVLICDSNKPHKQATVTLDLKRSAAFQCLTDWEGQPLSVTSINKLLRTKLYGSFDEKLIAIFKQVEFARAGSTTVTKEAHRDTMGKSVDNAVRSKAGDLPEIINFTTLLIQNAPCDPVTLKYYVDVDHGQEKIGIAAIGDFVEGAIEQTVSSLVERLKRELPAALVVAS